MVVSNVAFVPPFILGTFFLLAPCFVIGLVAGDTVSGIAACFLALAAFVFAKDNFFFSNILCALRTVSFLGAGVAMAILRIGGADTTSYMILTIPLLVAITAHWRIRRLIEAADLAI